MMIKRSTSEILGKKDNLAVILLNSRFSEFSRIFENLWDRAGIRICADGGANALYPRSERKIPDVIKGDLDSAREDVLTHFRELGTKIIRDPNQDTNDFGKCLEELNLRQGKSSLDIVVFGALGGRIDHEMCNLSYLYEWTKCFNSLTMLSDYNLVCLLDGPGRFTVIPDLSIEGPVCGILPVGSPCERVTTKGLKWNMNNQRLAFGEIVSSSNEIVDKVIEIQCSSPVIWTTELRLGDVASRL
jgi:thiamine pyrophosphokinase